MMKIKSKRKQSLHGNMDMDDETITYEGKKTTVGEVMKKFNMLGSGDDNANDIKYHFSNTHKGDNIQR